MEVGFSYEGKIIYIKQKKNNNNIQRICNIFCVSLEKYKRYLTYKNKNIQNSSISIVENINKIKIKYKN